MNVNGKTLAVTTIATLVVGSLLGAWYGARRNSDRIVCGVQTSFLSHQSRNTERLK